MEPANMHNRKGFTLVEIAVVLVIIGLVVSFAASMLRNVGGLSKLREAKDRVITVSDGVSSFAAKNNRLPTFAEFTSASAGFTSRDAWMKTYQIYPRLTFSTSPPTLFSNFTGNGLSTFCGRTSTRFAVCLNNSCSGSNLISDVAFAVISNGPNLTLNSTYPSPSGCPTGKLCLAIQEPSNTYDDLYKYVTLTELKKAGGCIESEAKLKIVNSELPNGKTGQSYKMKFYANGGVVYQGTSYRWCSDTSDINQVKLYAGATSTPISTSCSSPTTAAFVNFSGVPAAANSYSFTLTVKDSVQSSAGRTFGLTTGNP